MHSFSQHCDCTSEANHERSSLAEGHVEVHLREKEEDRAKETVLRAHWDVLGIDSAKCRFQGRAAHLTLELDDGSAGAVA